MPTSEDTAVMIAVLLDRDPIMAAKIKQHINPARLLELLDIKSEVPQPEEQAVIQDPEPLAELKNQS